MKINFLLLSFFLLLAGPLTAQTDQTWLDLDGTNDYLDLGANNILAGKTKFTVELRIHFDNTTGDYSIIGQRTSELNRTFVLQRWAGAFHVLMNDYNYGTCSFDPCPLRVYHLAVVYNGAAATNSERLKLYVDGVLQTLTFTGTIPGTSLVTSPPASLIVGCEYQSTISQIQYVDGQYAELAIWDYPLNATEINNRITNEVSGTETGLLEYFHFDNGTPNGNNTSVTSFVGGKGVCTATPKNMTMSGTGSNFIPKIVVPVTISGYVLTASTTGAVYQWLDCNNNLSIIPGATNQSYTGVANGSYAVRVMKGTTACFDTSNCYLLTPLGIDESELPNLSVSPNPFHNELLISNHNDQDITAFELLNAMGQVVLKGNFRRQVSISTNQLSPGMFFLRIKQGNSIEIRKLIKE